MDLQESLPAAHKGPENTSTPLKACNLSHKTLISCTTFSDGMGMMRRKPFCARIPTLSLAALPLCWPAGAAWCSGKLGSTSGVFLLHWLPCLRDRSTGSNSESWIPCMPGEETTDRNYLNMLSSTGQQLPRLPLGATAVSQQECRLYKVFKSIFFCVCVL